MKVRGVLLWLVFLALFAWTGYTAAGAGWNYFITQETVDRALREASSRHRAALSSGTQSGLDVLVADVHNSIMSAARHEGLPIRAEDVTVSANAGGVVARVRWSYRVLGLEDRDLLVIPISVQRSFGSTS